jgi:hypothetical protein
VAQAIVESRSGVPSTLTRGDSISFSVGGQYTDADGVTAWWTARGLADPVAGTFADNRWSFTLGSGLTAQLPEGPVDWTLYYLQGGQRRVSQLGTIVVAPDPVNGRELSANEKLVERLEAYLNGQNAENKDPMATSFSIDGVSYSFETPTAAIDLLQRVRRLVQDEEDRRRIARGNRSANVIAANFGGSRTFPNYYNPYNR